MGLFSNIREDIADMFAEYVIGSSRETDKAMALEIIREVGSIRNGPGGKEREFLERVKTRSVLRLKNGELLSTNLRMESFYTKAGNILKAYELLKTGLYSGREVSKICHVSWLPITKLLKMDESLKCICGKLLRSHRGWCSHRVGKSHKRQMFLLGWRFQLKDYENKRN